jgi:hypothetical protein
LSSASSAPTAIAIAAIAIAAIAIAAIAIAAIAIAAARNRAGRDPLPQAMDAGEHEHGAHQTEQPPAASGRRCDQL